MFKEILIRLRSATRLIVVLATVLGLATMVLAAQPNQDSAAAEQPPSTRIRPAMAPTRDASGPYYSVQSITLGDGTQLDRMTINGPPKPPPGYELERAPVEPSALNQPGLTSSLPVPAYSWVFGCSAVSASMIGAYFDRNGLPNIYTGPTDGGVMPMNNSVWPTWKDGANDWYPGNPLAASRNGSDGRVIRGSIDDYWDAYNSGAQDPYITGGWAQHTWGDAFGDYMKTSQSAYGNVDGSTLFYTWTSNAGPLTCATMASEHVADQDGTYGRKLFYEARGYTVADCYSRKTDNTITGGFSFADYKALIDAGYPILLNLEGHSVVGVGYLDPSTVYLNDTWDYETHSMTWGGSYIDMPLLSVSVVNPVVTLPVPEIAALDPPWTTPGGPGFTLTVNGANFVGTSEVRWNGAGRATEYVSATQLKATITLQDIAAPGTASVTVFNPAPGGGTSNPMSFTIGTVSLKKVYLPLALRQIPMVPAAPVLNPIENADGDGAYAVLWNASAGATSYLLQEDDNGGFSSPETRYSGPGTHWNAAGKSPGTYYYRVQASNVSGPSAWSNTQQVTVAGAVDFVNGDFEAGSTGWTQYSTHGWGLITTSFPGTVYARSGSWAAWLGGDYEDISYVRQQVTVPPSRPYLAYWHWIASEDSCGHDLGGVIVNDSDVVDVYTLCSNSNTGGWVKHTVNLGAHAGQSISIQIRAETNSSLNSNLFVDDVAFQSSASGPEGESPPTYDPTTGLSKRDMGESPQGTAVPAEPKRLLGGSVEK
jgi:hypothetical protein